MSKSKDITQWTDQEIADDLFNAAGRYEKATSEQQAFIERTLKERTPAMSIEVRCYVDKNSGEYVAQRNKAIMELLNIARG